MGELQSPIKNLKVKGEAGFDSIPPSFLKSLGRLALQELLSISKSPFPIANCAQTWRIAIIIPLLKAVKSPNEVTSFRPIDLTSCIVKLLERILVDRLYYNAETKNLFSQFQAGIHEGQSCEDQITWIFQTIEDGSQQRPMKRSVMTLLDFSKTYDTVWRERLLLHMLDNGISSTFIRWIRSFFNNQQSEITFSTLQRL